MVLFTRLQNFFVFFKKKLSLFWKKGKKRVKRLSKYFKKVAAEHSFFIESCQLSVIYLLCLVSTAKSVRSLVLIYPPVVRFLFPFCETICDFPLFFYIGNSDYSVFYYPILTQIVFQKRFVHFSEKIRFHISYVLLLDLFQSVILYWIVLYFGPEFTEPVDVEIYLPIILSIFFSIFHVIYVYSYIMGLRKLIPELIGPFKLLSPFVKSCAFSVGLVKKEKEN